MKRLICLVLFAMGCTFEPGPSIDIKKNESDADSSGTNGADGSTDTNVTDTGTDVSPDLTATCGNDQLDPNETCDPTDTCPTECDDMNTCTTDILSGSPQNCDALCPFDPVTTCTDDDGCCAPGCDLTTDNDCDAVCGNGVVEAPEVCDGNDCPTACDDALACTTDSLSGDATTCDAVCNFDPIVICDAVADGCCPTMCNANNDADCQPVCGNNIVEGAEACDGNCPTTCDDNVSCTDNILVGDAATCDAVCTYPNIVVCDVAASDNCCPSNCNENTDMDCQAVCGNGIVEPGESCDPVASCPVTCDDGDACTTDVSNGSPATCNVECANTPVTSCSLTSDGCCPSTCNSTNDADCVATPTAYRIDTLALRDPHAFTEFFTVCIDITGTVNSNLQSSLTNDDNNDGFLDLSLLLVQRPSNPASASPLPFEVSEGTCTAPAAGTSCDQALPVSATTYTNRQSGICSATIANTTSGYSPAIVEPTAACFEGVPTTLTLDLGGILIPLSNLNIGGKWNGNPSSTLTQGILYGFISETDANAIIIPPSTPQIGGQPLSSILAGGTGNCSPTDDKDTVNNVDGWWMYLNYTASAVTYTGS